MQTYTFECDVDSSRHLVLDLPKSVAPGRHRVSVIIDPAPTVTSETEAQPTVDKPLIGDAVVDHYQPRTELGRKLIALRRAHIEAGGKLLTQDEILAEVRRSRGEDADD